MIFLTEEISNQKKETEKLKGNCNLNLQKMEGKLKP